MRYSAKRQYEWGQGVAYCVGLMASDGCLQKDGRHLDITSVDYDQLVNFKDALKRPDLRITNKKSGANRPAYRIQFSDTALYDFLISTGLTPAKSKTIAGLKIPRRYYADFLRGIFDGDGTVYGYRDTRWKSSYMFYMGFASASLSFLIYIREMNTAFFGVGGGSIRHGKRAACLYYAKTDSKKLYKAMYPNSKMVCLARKRDKLESFIFGGSLL